MAAAAALFAAVFLALVSTTSAQGFLLCNRVWNGIIKYEMSAALECTSRAVADGMQTAECASLQCVSHLLVKFAPGCATYQSEICHGGAKHASDNGVENCGQACDEVFDIDLASIGAAEPSWGANSTLVHEQAALVGKSQDAASPASACALAGTMPDAKKVQESVSLVWRYKMGQMVSLLIHVGDRLDLFKALAGQGKPVTTAELAKHTGLHARWLMEWLRGMAAAKILSYEEGSEESERFLLPPEMAEVLANDQDSLVFAAGAFEGLQQKELSDGLVHAFRTGIGMSYKARSLVLGDAAALSTKRLLGTWTRLALVQVVVKALGGGALAQKLKQGGRILDMGCGAGVASCCLSAAFPKAVVHGVDPDIVALEVARQDAKAAGLENVEFIEGKGEEYGDGLSGTYDFAVCMDIVHDCPFPDRILASLWRLLKPGGILLVKDIKSTGSFPENLKKIGSLAMLYGFSVSSCLSSALSEPGGMGLGTVGFNPPVAARMCSEAGFSNFTQHDFKDPTNLYYEMIKPGGSGVLTPKATSGLESDLSSMPAPAFCACHRGTVAPIACMPCTGRL